MRVPSSAEFLFILLLALFNANLQSLGAPLLLGQLLLPQQAQVESVEEVQLRAAIVNGVEQAVQHLPASHLSTFILKKVRDFQFRCPKLQYLINVSPEDIML